MMPKESSLWQRWSGSRTAVPENRLSVYYRISNEGREHAGEQCKAALCLAFQKPNVYKPFWRKLLCFTSEMAAALGLQVRAGFICSVEAPTGELLDAFLGLNSNNVTWFMRRYDVNVSTKHSAESTMILIQSPNMKKAEVSFCAIHGACDRSICFLSVNSPELCCVF
jgi:hypothetical protein